MESQSNQKLVADSYIAPPRVPYFSQVIPRILSALFTSYLTSFYIEVNGVPLILCVTVCQRPTPCNGDVCLSSYPPVRSVSERVPRPPPSSRPRTSTGLRGGHIGHPGVQTPVEGSGVLHQTAVLPSTSSSTTGQVYRAPEVLAQELQVPTTRYGSNTSRGPGQGASKLGRILP